MPNRTASSLTAAVLALVAGPALAQSASVQPQAAQTAPAAPGSTVSGVTVEAPATPKVIKRQSWDFTLSFGSAGNPEVDQIDRWWEPVCVQVSGVTDRQQTMIKARIESVAEAVGLPKARRGCKPNVEVMFTDRPQDAMDWVWKRREQLLGYYHRHDGKQLKTVKYPVQAWYVTATRAVLDRAGALYGIDQPTSGEVVDDPDNRTPACASSPFSVCADGLFKNVLVVADSRALQGKDAGLLSDYLVMLTLARPRKLDVCNSLPSVLDVLSPAQCPHDKPDGLTPGDAAYLTALYKADLSYRKNFAEGDISDRMSAILIKAAATQNR
jgi:hypothetical protein